MILGMRRSELIHAPEPADDNCVGCCCHSWKRLAAYAFDRPPAANIQWPFFLKHICEDTL